MGLLSLRCAEEERDQGYAAMAGFGLEARRVRYLLLHGDRATVKAASMTKCREPQVGPAQMCDEPCRGHVPEGTLRRIEIRHGGGLQRSFRLLR